MNQPSVTIRPAQPGDAHTVFDLLCDVFGQTLLPYTIFQAPSSLHYLESIVERQKSDEPHIVVAVSRGQVVGFYDASAHDKTFHLKYVGVAPRSQGTGVGKELLHHFEHQGRARNCAVLSLDVFESNHRAWRWYRRHDYQEDRGFYMTRVVLPEVVER